MVIRALGSPATLTRLFGGVGTPFNGD
jgi:hypothetical protein